MAKKQNTSVVAMHYQLNDEEIKKQIKDSAVMQVTGNLYLNLGLGITQIKFVNMGY